MSKSEYLRGLIERTDNWYHKHIYQTQLDRITGKTAKVVYPTYVYFLDGDGKTHYEVSA